jgi:hypothetical protein
MVAAKITQQIRHDLGQETDRFCVPLSHTKDTGILTHFRVK